MRSITILELAKTEWIVTKVCAEKIFQNEERLQFETIQILLNLEHFDAAEQKWVQCLKNEFNVSKTSSDVCLNANCRKSAKERQPQ